MIQFTTEIKNLNVDIEHLEENFGYRVKITGKDLIKFEIVGGNKLK